MKAQEALLCLGLREIHSSDFSNRNMVEKLRSFARYGLTRHFNEILGDRAFEDRPAVPVSSPLSGQSN
ncbi:hypothetical protein JST97_38690 [bacterium]|nr:hypothetical protein [bacterium]